MSPKTQVGALSCGAYGTPVRPPWLCYYPVVVPSLRMIAANARATLHRRRIDAKKSHKRMLTVAQAAAMYHVCQNTVYKWCRAGLEKKRVSGLVLLNPRAIQQYLLFGRKCRR